MESLLALVEAAGQALLATLFVDEGRLAALLAEVADLARARRARRGGDGLAHLADVLAEHARERVGQREHLGRAEAGGLAAPDPQELVDDLLEAPARGQRRRQ